MSEQINENDGADIIFTCPHCGGHLTVERAGAGMFLPCGHCSKQVKVPSAACLPGCSPSVTSAGRRATLLMRRVVAVSLLLGTAAALGFWVVNKRAHPLEFPQKRPTGAEHSQKQGEADRNAKTVGHEGIDPHSEDGASKKSGILVGGFSNPPPEVVRPQVAASGAPDLVANRKPHEARGEETNALPIVLTISFRDHLSKGFYEKLFTHPPHVAEGLEAGRSFHLADGSRYEWTDPETGLPTSNADLADRSYKSGFLWALLAASRDRGFHVLLHPQILHDALQHYEKLIGDVKRPDPELKPDPKQCLVLRLQQTIRFLKLAIAQNTLRPQSNILESSSKDIKSQDGTDERLGLLPPWDAIYSGDWSNEVSLASLNEISTTLRIGLQATLVKSPPFKNRFGNAGPYDIPEVSLTTYQASHTIKRFHAAYSLPESFNIAFGDNVQLYIARDADRKISDFIRQCLGSDCFQPGDSAVESTLRSSLTSAGQQDAKPSVPNASFQNPPDGWPPFAAPLSGSMEVRIRNPNDFDVRVGLRTGRMGKDFVVHANDTGVARIPPGQYKIYFQYSSDPTSLYQGDDFSLYNNDVEIQIVRMVNGNYGIRKVH